MNSGVTFAWLAAIVFGLWTVFHQLASSHVNKLFGAIVVSLTAVILGSIFLIPQLRTVKLYTDPKGLIFVVLAGICALGIDFFVLKAYGTGLQVSVGGPIVIGGSIAIAALIGFLLGDSVTAIKVLAIGLILAGAIILSRFNS